MINDSLPKSLILNIGLDIKKKRNAVAPLKVYNFLEISRFHIEAWEIIPEHTHPLHDWFGYGRVEKTIWTIVTPPIAWADKLDKLSKEIKQDAIAAFDPANGEGETFGPNLGKWQFNPVFFQFHP